MYPRATKGWCAACRAVVPAEIVEESGALVFHLRCPECGERAGVVEHDAELYKRWESARRPNRPPETAQTAPERGCPLDCGLCPDHRQKSCVALVEVTTACDLGCPVCFADSGGGGAHRPLDEIGAMLDACVQAANGKPDIVQISGGEPACHPQLLDILRAAKARPFKYVMLNTNGLAIADGRLSCADLKSVGLGFEVHLQFDGMDDAAHTALRGRPLLAQKLAALDRLAQHGIPVTLVATLRNGVNMDGLGGLLRFALDHPAVRGLNLQCEARFGRNDTRPGAERVTQTQTVRALERQVPELLTAEDFLPLSCGLASLAYLERMDGAWRPLPPALAGVIPGNPMTTSIEDLHALAAEMCACRGAALLEEVAGRLPANLLEMDREARSRLVQERFFHVTVISFLDADNFDLDRACRECTHVVQPDGRKIPFSAFNTIHREAGHAPA